MLLVRDESIFLIRRFNTGFADGFYSVPAGRVEDGELVPETTAREAMEEVGIALKPESLTLAHVMHIRKTNPAEPDLLQFFFTCSSWDGEPHNTEPERCDHADWFPLSALPENTVPYARQAIEHFYRGVHFSHIDE